MIHGVGINDAGYVTQNCGWVCPYYSRWKDMIVRCYSPKRLSKKSSYVGCVVCEEWRTFSNFRRWMVKQEETLGDLSDLTLDKDILSGVNKVYTPEHCVFVTTDVNKFFCDHSSKHSHMIGAQLRGNGKYRCRVSDPNTHKVVGCGNYDTELEAHNAWGKKRYEFALIFAQSPQVVDNRVRIKIIERYEAYNVY